MTTADHGNFGLVLEIPEATAAVAAAAVPFAAAALPVNTAGATGNFVPAVAVAGVDFLPAETVGIRLSLAGSVFNVQALTGFPGPIPPAFANVAIDGVVTVTTRLVTAGRAVQITYAPASGLPTTTVVLDTSLIGAQPLVQLFLANAFLQGGAVGYFAARTQLFAALTTLVGAAVGLAVLARPNDTLFTAPATLGAAPGGGAAIPVTSVGILTLGQSLKVFLALGRPAGFAATAPASRVLLSGTGVPLDALVVNLANGGLLTDILRPTLIATLGLPPGGFLPGTPCAFAGPAPVAIPGTPLPVTVTSLVAGIDEAGALNIVTNIVAADPTGGLSITATITQRYTFTAVAAGGTVTLTATSTGPPVVVSDVVIALWVYVAAAFGGGLLLAGLLLTADLFLGAMLNGPISMFLAGAIPRTITVPAALPPGLPVLVTRLTNFVQPEAPRGTIPFPAGIVANPFRDHDLIVNFV